MQTSSGVQISKDLPETMLEVDHKTKNRLNRNALGVAKARTTVYSSAQQKIALVRNVTSRAIIRTLYCFSKDVSLLSEDNNLEFEKDAFLGSLE